MPLAEADSNALRKFADVCNDFDSFRTIPMKWRHRAGSGDEPQFRSPAQETPGWAPLKCRSRQGKRLRPL